MKHIDPSFYPAPHAALGAFDPDDRTIVLVTVSRYRGEDAIARIKSALPGSDIINLSQLYIDRNLGDHDHGTKSPVALLTLRQQEILDYLLGGLSNKEIGRKLGLSHFTVRNHVSNILRILNFPCRREMRRSLGVDRSAPTYPISLVA
ncbi:response regulator transcription factor [Sphingopyxis sp.]|jgi:DNA-binding NarL/FixJ family response regulator|uniref:response regulator transcription factor n=1 Tax=Sphingopyxis sp. TaxID=1908224 RepID=UPI003F70E395